MNMKLLNIRNRNNYQEKKKGRKETIQRYENIYNTRIILFR